MKDPAEVDKMLTLFGHTGREPALRINPDCFSCQHCVSYFLSTAFLCCGTATDPEKGYTIEFLSQRYHVSRQLEAILSEHHFRPHRTLRKGANVVYIKASDPDRKPAGLHGRRQLCHAGDGTAHVQRCAQPHQPALQLRDRKPGQERPGGGSGADGHPHLAAGGGDGHPAGTLAGDCPPAHGIPGPAAGQAGGKFDPPVSKAGLSHRFKRIQEAAHRVEAARPQPDTTQPPSRKEVP